MLKTTANADFNLFIQRSSNQSGEFDTLSSQPQPPFPFAISFKKVGKIKYIQGLSRLFDSMVRSAKPIVVDADSLTGHDSQYNTAFCKAI
jgi:hypothetical protein